MKRVIIKAATSNVRSLRNLSYPRSLYTDSRVWTIEDIGQFKAELVKVKEPTKCFYCEDTIPKGSYCVHAVREGDPNDEIEWRRDDDEQYACTRCVEDIIDDLGIAPYGGRKYTGKYSEAQYTSPEAIEKVWSHMYYPVLENGVTVENAVNHTMCMHCNGRIESDSPYVKVIHVLDTDHELKDEYGVGNWNHRPIPLQVVREHMLRTSVARYHMQCADYKMENGGF